MNSPCNPVPIQSRFQQPARQLKKKDIIARCCCLEGENLRSCGGIEKIECRLINRMVHVFGLTVMGAQSVEDLRQALDEMPDEELEDPVTCLSKRLFVVRESIAKINRQ